MQSIVQTARRTKEPAIEKWENIEKHVFLLLTLSVASFCALFINRQFYGGITLLGGLNGALIAGVYISMFAQNLTLAFVMAMLAASVSAVTVACYAALPLWLLMGNGLPGALFVISLVALWTKRQH